MKKMQSTAGRTEKTKGKMHNFKGDFLCNLTIFRFNALISWDIKEMKLTGEEKCSKMALIKIQPPGSFRTLKQEKG